MYPFSSLRLISGSLPKSYRMIEGSRIERGHPRAASTVLVFDFSISIYDLHFKFEASDASFVQVNKLKRKLSGDESIEWME